MNARESKKTTGWTEQTRNQFHPGDIITAIKLDYSGYSPFNLLGVTELVCHVLGEGREYCQPHITEDGAIMGFYFNVLPRVKLIQNDLRKQFPQIAEFADSLDKEKVDKIFSSKEKIVLLVEEIEKKFGKTVQVLPLKLTEQESDDNIENAQMGMLSMFAKGGAKVIVVVPEEEQQNQATCKM